MTAVNILVAASWRINSKPKSATRYREATDPVALWCAA
jgi:hypothetical protein